MTAPTLDVDNLRRQFPQEVVDYLNDLFTDLGCVDDSSNQDIDGIKTFIKEIVLPSKSTAAGNNPTKPATEAQVYKKQDRNTVSETEPSNPNIGDEWYDSSENKLKIWNGEEWKLCGGGGGGGGHDYSWTTLTGTSLTITQDKYRNVISTSSDVTVATGTDLTPGVEYILRIVNTDTAVHTMTFDNQVYLIPAGGKVNFRFLALDETTLDFEGPRFVSEMPLAPDEGKIYHII